MATIKIEWGIGNDIRRINSFIVRFWENYSVLAKKRKFNILNFPLLKFSIVYLFATGALTYVLYASQFSSDENGVMYAGLIFLAFLIIYFGITVFVTTIYFIRLFVLFIRAIVLTVKRPKLKKGSE